MKCDQNLGHCGSRIHVHQRAHFTQLMASAALLVLHVVSFAVHLKFIFRFSVTKSLECKTAYCLLTVLQPKKYTEVPFKDALKIKRKITL